MSLVSIESISGYEYINCDDRDVYLEKPGIATRYVLLARSEFALSIVFS